MIDPVRARINVQAVVTPNATTPTVPAKPDAKLKKAVGDLEGVFVQQLFKAMRDTVPQGDGIVSGGSGEDIFTSLMDQHLAAETPNQWKGGIGEALYRQLRHGGVPPTTIATPATLVPDIPTLGTHSDSSAL